MSFIVTISSSAKAINDAGEVGAETYTFDLRDAEDEWAEADNRAYYWKSPDQAIRFGIALSENNYYTPIGVSEDGMIVGNTGSYEYDVFYYSASGGVSGYIGEDIIAVDVNRAGQVAVIDDYTSYRRDRSEQPCRTAR